MLLHLFTSLFWIVTPLYNNKMKEVSINNRNKSKLATTEAMEMDHGKSA
jgi:hypothetical protein